MAGCCRFSRDHLHAICLEEWKADEVLKARLAMARTFVIWPSDDAGKKKPNEVALKLNISMLLPLVGRAEVCPKVIAVDVLEPLLLQLRDDVQVPLVLFYVFFPPASSLSPDVNDRSNCMGMSLCLIEASISDSRCRKDAHSLKALVHHHASRLAVKVMGEGQ